MKKLIAVLAVSAIILSLSCTFLVCQEAKGEEKEQPEKKVEEKAKAEKRPQEEKELMRIKEEQRMRERHKSCITSSSKNILVAALFSLMAISVSLLPTSRLFFLIDTPTLLKKEANSIPI